LDANELRDRFAERVISIAVFEDNAMEVEMPNPVRIGRVLGSLDPETKKSLVHQKWPKLRDFSTGTFSIILKVCFPSLSYCISPMI
jgi:hypothetical protein